MNRAEHLAWAKQRALDYVDRGDLTQAITSMLSDLGKHPETEASSHGVLAALAFWHLTNNSGRPEVRRFIEGFN